MEADFFVHWYLTLEWVLNWGGKGEGNEAYFLTLNIVEKYDGIKKQIFIQIVHKFFFSLTTTFAVFLHYLSVTL